MRKLLSGIALSMVIVLTLGTPTFAADNDEAKLQTVQKDIDREPTKNDEARVQSLAKEFKVPPAAVQDLRSHGQGWGTITIELSMAQQLYKTDPKTYPTMTDALAKIQTLRSENKGWGRIAKELGFKLGPVISATQHARHEMKTDARAEKASPAARADKADKPSKPEHAQRPERAERHAERTGGPDKPGKN